MLRKIFILCLLVLLTFNAHVLAQNDNQKPSVIRIEGSGQYSRSDVDLPANPNQQLIQADGFSYSTPQGGIILLLPKQNNYVRLFALTGQLIWSGELVSGRFFIPVGKGIYFLRVNNKSYKLNCK